MCRFFWKFSRGGWKGTEIIIIIKNLLFVTGWTDNISKTTNYTNLANYYLYICQNERLTINDERWAMNVERFTMNGLRWTVYDERNLSLCQKNDSGRYADLPLQGKRYNNYNNYGNFCLGKRWTLSDERQILWRTEIIIIIIIFLVSDRWANLYLSFCQNKCWTMNDQSYKSQNP